MRAKLEAVADKHFSLRCIFKGHSPIRIEKGYVCKFCGHVMYGGKQ